MKQLIIITLPIIALVFGMSCAVHRVHSDNKETFNADIEIEVLKNMIAEQGYTKDAFGALFCDVDPLTAVYLPYLANDSTPRIEFGRNNLISASTGFIDKITGKPALLLTTRVISVSNNVALVEGGRVQGLTGGVWRMYTLNLIGSHWLVVKRSPQTFSDLNKEFRRGKLSMRPRSRKPTIESEVPMRYSLKIRI